MDRRPLAQDPLQRSSTELTDSLRRPAEPPAFGAPRGERAFVDQLEADGLVVLSDLGFHLEPGEARFLTAAVCEAGVKSVSHNPNTGALRGTSLVGGEAEALTAMLARYMVWAEALTGIFAPRYFGRLHRGRTSFRPRDIAGPVLSARRDDRRLHADAFASQPTGGRRILRVFSNINPYGQERIWQVGEPFEDYARRFLPRARRPWPGEGWLLRQLGITKAARTTYDALMLGMHDAAKLDAAYQTSAPRREIAFAPGCSWIVFTDSVVHAATAGQHALEQTFYLPVEAMADPSASPLRILERLTGRRLA